jgi:hypothetical protein
MEKSMKDTQMRKASELFQTASEAFAELSAMFSSDSSDDAGGSTDGKATKPVRGAKSAASTKPTSKKKEEKVELTQDDVRDALRELVELRGKEVMIQALESVGAGKLADVDESQYEELMEKVNELKETEPDEAPSTKAKPKGKAKKGPTLDDVTAAAKALIDADKPAYVKLTKKLGKPSEMEEDDYVAAIAAYEEAMPEEGGEDDLL